MKRFLLSAFLLFFSATLFSAEISYQPSLEINGGGNISVFYEESERAHNARTNPALGIKADFLSLVINKHRLSFPVCLSYDFESCEMQYRIVQPRLSLSLMTEYTYRITNLFYISLAIGPRYDWFYKVHGSLWYLDASIEAGIRPIDMLSISIPVTASISDAGYEAEARIALTFHLDSIFRGE